MSQSYNPWDHKPWWCQPWTILLTGSMMIGSSWLLFHRVWLSLLVSAPIVIWWIYFLILWPRLMREGMESQSQY